MTAMNDVNLKEPSAWRKRREDRMRDMLPDEDNDIGKYDNRLLLRLFSYVTPYRTRLILSIIYITIASILSSILPFLISQAIDLGVTPKNIEALRFWIFLFIAASVVEWLVNRERIRTMAWVGSGVVVDIRGHLFRHLHALSLNFHNNYAVGRMMSRLLGDITILRDFITWSITGLFRSTFALLGIVIAMLLLNWRLALLSFSVLPIMAIVTNYWRVYIRVAYRAARARSSIISGYFNESISGIRVTKSFTREAENTEYFDMLNASYRSANVRATRLTAMFFPSVDLMGSLSAAIVVIYGGSLVLDEQLSAGVLIAFVLYVQQFFNPIRELAMRFNVFQGTMASSERIFSLLDVKPDMNDREGAHELPPIQGHVQFKDVDFAYKPDEPVLNHVNIEAKPGQQIALVGETGAGKSTIIRLLARFFEVTGGEILIDGHNLQEVTQDSLRQQLGVVLQDTFLFSGSIMDNIRYGRLDATDMDVINAAKAVGADVFIRNLPEGYETEIGENGVNLSVGQRQILSFARALLADPRILVLDEATSSVDTATERQIQAALEKLLEGRTSFVIAHRLNTIVKSDKIVVLDRGNVVETGTHAELLEKRGRYYNLYTMTWAAEAQSA